MEPRKERELIWGWVSTRQTLHTHLVCVSREGVEEEERYFENE